MVALAFKHRPNRLPDHGSPRDPAVATRTLADLRSAAGGLSRRTGVSAAQAMTQVLGRSSSTAIEPGPADRRSPNSDLRSVEHAHARAPPPLGIRARVRHAPAACAHAPEPASARTSRITWWASGTRIARTARVYT